MRFLPVFARVGACQLGVWVHGGDANIKLLTGAGDSSHPYHRLKYSGHCDVLLRSDTDEQP